MTQPKYAPITEDGEVRPAYRLAPPRPWVLHRVAELRPGGRAPRRIGGVPGPDQGYALLLAARLADRLVLEPGEHAEDVLAGAVAIGLRRAALFGRAPVSADLELALSAFGYLGEAPAGVVARRQALFAGAAHDYVAERRLAALLPDRLLRRSAGETDAAEVLREIGEEAGQAGA